MARDLAKLLGKGAVSTAPEELERHSRDALGEYRAFRARELLHVRLDVVVYPRSTEQVQQVVQFAVQTGTPIVPYGGGTGVMGGIVPVRGGIVINLRGLDQIHRVDAEARTVTVGAGVILEDLAREASSRGLLLGHDPWSLPIATAGGAISTNGVGYLAAKYGSMGQQVLGLEVVLPSGTVLQTKPVPKTSGPSWNALFIGAEGALGIITQATLQLFPEPERRCLSAFSFGGFEAGFHAVMEMYATGLGPAMVDFAEEPANGEDGPAKLYLGFEGPVEEAEAQTERAKSIFVRHGGKPLSHEEAQEFWQTRHQSGERYKREVLERPPSARNRRADRWRMDYLHVAIPASKVLEYRRRCQELLRGYGIPVHEWSLWARPEFFSFLVADPSPATEQDTKRMAAAVDQLLEAAQDLGGSMEYCHGVGLKLGHLMKRELGPGMELFRQIKGALDPNNILNPGKLGL
ncbi:MAG: FAD-binding oxidoreductase [Chloroflexi bacterium]|nr:FAD-binding oxidoreductase [Chloroflexota bacterium]